MDGAHLLRLLRSVCLFLVQAGELSRKPDSVSVIPDSVSVNPDTVRCSQERAACEALNVSTTDSVPASTKPDRVPVNPDTVRSGSQERAECEAKAGEHGSGLREAELNVTIVHDRCHEALYTGHWKDVPLAWRAAYRFTCHVQCLLAVWRSGGASRAALRAADMGLMMGAPLLDVANGAMAQAAARAMDLAVLAAALQAELSAHTGGESDADPALVKEVQRPTDTRAPFTPADLRDVARLRLPTLEHFAKLMEQGLPVVIEGAIDHWPALRRWRDMAYLKVGHAQHHWPLGVVCFNSSFHATSIPKSLSTLLREWQVIGLCPWSRDGTTRRPPGARL